MAERSDDELLEAARGGDRAALEALLARHQARVYRFGMKMCGDPEDAKEVLQETLLTAARKLREFRGASSISTWLYAIARSFCIKQRRRSKFAPAAEESLDADPAAAGRLEHPAPPPDEQLASREIQAALQQAIGDLDPMYREVLILRDVEGLTAPEVGDVLGLSVEAVKSRLHRARLAVRASLAPLLGVPAEGAAEAPAAGGCPDVLTLFSRHLEGEISSDLCAEMERHLATCPRCRGACDSLRHTLAACRAAPAPAVPSRIQDSVRKALRDLLADQDPPPR